MGSLITVPELADELAGGRPPRVLDVRWFLAGRNGRAEFEQAHLPGAQWVDLDTELAAAPSAAGRHPLPDPATFEAAMQRVGLQPGEPVVAMDDGSLMGAARLWWLLRDAGVAVRVLDGGLAAWTAAGHPTKSGPARPVPPGAVALTSGRMPRIDTDEVAARSIRGQRLWDVRAAERYRGEVEPIDPVAGHIPGAVNLPAAESFDDGRLRPAAELDELFADIRPGDAVYCGSGVTATQTLLALDVAGVQGVRLYPGSWSAWITDPARPVANGRDN